MRNLVILAIVSGSAVVCSGAAAAGDAGRGAKLLRENRCLECHGMAGEGGRRAPDLGRRVGRGSSPAALVATLWNHAPAMWSAMESRGIEPPAVSEAQAADLFAYFHSIQYFERPGDAARGKRLFDNKRCSGCHALNSGAASGGPPVAEWGSLKSPVELARRMWNHAGAMQEAMANRSVSYPQVTAQELTDLLVYIEHLPAAGNRSAAFVLPAAAGGEGVLDRKGCNNCHTGKLAFEKRGNHHTLTDFAAAMWNHAPQMRRAGELPRIEPGEMEPIVAALWSGHLYRDDGDPVRGKRIAAEKRCGTCHGETAAPAFHEIRARRALPFEAFAMASALWRHGPLMFKQMQAANVPWPQFSAPEMADLIAYLNAPR